MLSIVDVGCDQAVAEKQVAAEVHGGQRRPETHSRLNESSTCRRVANDLPEAGDHLRGDEADIHEVLDKEVRLILDRPLPRLIP